MTETGGRLAARRATSAKARIAAKDFKGVTGDPWAPVAAGKEEKGLTLGEGDFTYRRLCDLVFSDDWLTSPLARPGPGEGASLLAAEAISRGNSKTDGFKSRVVPAPARALGLGRRDAGHHARAQIEEIKVFDEALRNALALAAAGGDIEKLKKPHYARTVEARARFDRLADARFFPALWDRLAATNEEARIAAARRFLRDLLAAARQVMGRRCPGSPARPCSAQGRKRGRGGRSMPGSGRVSAAIAISASSSRRRPPMS